MAEGQILARIPWTIAPHTGARLDKTNPLSPDVFCCFAGNDGWVREVVDDLTPVTQKNFRRPDGFRPNDTNGDGGPEFDVNFTPPLIGSTTFYYRDEGSLGNKNFLASDGDFFFRRNTAAEIFCQVDTGFTFTNVPSSLFDGSTHWVTITWRHTGSSETHRLYMDGVEVDSVTSTLFNPLDVATKIFVGRSSGTSFLEIEATLNLVMVHSRNLLIGEIIRLHANAWQIFQPRTQYIPVGVADLVGTRRYRVSAY